MKLMNLIRPLLVAGVLIVLLTSAAGSLAQVGGAPPAAPAGAPAVQPAAPAAGTKPGVLSIIPMDPVTLTVALLSIAGVTLIVQAFLKTRSAVYMPPATVEQMRQFIAQRQYRELLELTATDPSFIARVLHPALKRAPSITAMKESLETSVSEQTADAFRRIEYLNIIGNLGPLLGLLGTVLGMIQAFLEVKTAGGQANVGTLSGGIATALAHTLLGLMLAVPCLACFGILRTMIDRLTVKSALLADDLLIGIIGDDGKGTLAMGGGPAAPATSPGIAPRPSVNVAPKQI
jgi:biopolymer transport protein ExbB